MADVRNVEAPVELWVGPHLFRWEPPDMGYVAYNGDVDGPTMMTYTEKSRVYTGDKPRVFLIVNCSKLGRIDAEARRVSANGSKGLALRGVAVVGASRTTRVLASLFVRAIEILNRNLDNPTRFFENEAEARAWIDTRRRALHEIGPRVLSA
jgi:hypothetical protein